MSPKSDPPAPDPEEEPEYEQEPELEEEESGGSLTETAPLLPVILLALSFTVFLAWETIGSVDQRSTNQAILQRQDQPLKNGRQWHAVFEKIATDLFDLSRTDDNAKSVIVKYGLQQRGAAPPAQP